MLVMDGREALLKSDDEDELIFDHTSLLNKEISFRDLSKKLYANGCKLQIARTINLCFSFFGLGLCFAIPTATLEDLKRSTGAGLDIRHIYTARYSGYLFGSLLGGFLFDRYNRQFLLFLSLLATSIGVIVMPFCSNVGSLMACTAITGITMGFLDTGGNVWCLDLWGRRSAPIMQTLHFCFGLGAFVAPLVAEPFLSPLYLNSSVGFEGNSTAGNATHRISHINFLHSGAQIKNLVPRGVENGNLSLEILADYEYSKYLHFMVKRNATDNSSLDFVKFGSNNETQLNATTENLDDLLNTTSSTTVIPVRTFKPKPQYADGNQLKQKDKWDRPSNKIQSIVPNSNSTTTVATSTVPITTQQHPELISSRNDSEQNNSSGELMPDDKGNATFDSSNTTRPFEDDVTLVSLPPNATPQSKNYTTKETSSTVTREVSSTPSILENISLPNQTHDGIEMPQMVNTTISTTSKGPTSAASVTSIFTTAPTNLENNTVPVRPIIEVETTTQADDKSNRKENIHTRTENHDISTGSSSSKDQDEAINSSPTTVLSSQLLEFLTPSIANSTVAPTNSSTTSVVSTISSVTSSVDSPKISGTTFVVSTTMSTTTSFDSPTNFIASTISTTEEPPAMPKQSFEEPKASAGNGNENTDSKESVNVTILGVTGTENHSTVQPTDTSPANVNTTDKQQHLQVSGTEAPDPNKVSSNSGESQLPVANSKNSQNVPETTSSPATTSSGSTPPSILQRSKDPFLENETPKKPATPSTTLEYPKQTKPAEEDSSRHPYPVKEHDLVTESDFRPSKDIATSYTKSTTASQIATLETTTAIENNANPFSKSDPGHSVTVSQHKFVTPFGTLAENEVNPAEVDRDIVVGKNRHKVGINRVKNSNVLTAQDGDNFTEPISGSEKKGHHLDALTDLFDALRKNRLGKFEIAYVILGLYVFVVAVVFLVFLCKNPREPRSRQLEELNKMREESRCFTYTMVCLLSLFLCLYVGIEVAVGEVLQTFASMETLRLSTASGYFLSYLFWGGFAISRFVTIIISMKFSGFCILLTNLTICLVASIMLVAGADKIEALLWLGTVILGLGVGPLFPTAIAWVERYVHVTNKTASVFIFGAAFGEIVIPIIINAFINQEPMVLMYVNIIVNALCFISFVILSVLAFRHGEKYLKKPKRSLYRLANMDDTEDGTELITNSFSNSNGTETGVKQRYRKLCT